jgi:hypothetical protein
MDNEIVLRDDTLKTLDQISDFLGEDLYRTQRLLTKGVYPAAKIQGRWTASKQQLRERHALLLSGKTT